MNRKLVALTAAAVMSLSATAPAVQAMDMEFNMLTGAVYNALSSRGISTDGMSNLTLNQVGQIRGILDSDDIPDLQKTQRIEAILRQQ